MRRLSLVFVCLTLLWAACTKVAKEKSGPSITVLKPGIEPRYSLGYTFQKGHNFRRQVNYVQESLMGGKRNRLPPMFITVDFTVTETAAESATLTFDIVNAGLSNSATASDKTVYGEQFGAWLKEVESLKKKRAKGETVLPYTLTVSTKTGAVTDVHLPKAAPQSLQAAMAGMRAGAILFPKAPIGVGGRWLVDSSYSQAGHTVTRKTFYTLVEYFPGAMTIDITVQEKAVDQPLKLDGFSKAVNATVDGNGKGRLSLVPGEYPPKGIYELNSKVRTTVDELPLVLETRTKRNVR